MMTGLKNINFDCNVYTDEIILQIYRSKEEYTLEPIMMITLIKN